MAEEKRSRGRRRPERDRGAAADETLSMSELNCFDSMNAAVVEVRVLESAEGFISVNAAATTEGGESVDGDFVECG